MIIFMCYKYNLRILFHPNWLQIYILFVVVQTNTKKTYN